MQWYPHVTVATVIEKDGKFLLVEEFSSEGERVLNQPAGHLEADETLVEAAMRETLEETGWKINVQGVVGLGLYTAPSNGVTYHRTTFFAEAVEHLPEQPLDDGIIGPVWMTLEEIEAASERLRSRLVTESIQRYLDGHRYPLDMVYS